MITIGLEQIFVTTFERDSTGLKPDRAGFAGHWTPLILIVMLAWGWIFSHPQRKFIVCSSKLVGQRSERVCSLSHLMLHFTYRA